MMPYTHILVISQVKIELRLAGKDSLADFTLEVIALEVEVKRLLGEVVEDAARLQAVLVT